MLYYLIKYNLLISFVQHMINSFQLFNVISTEAAVVSIYVFTYVFITLKVFMFIVLLQKMLYTYVKKFRGLVV